MTAPIGLRVAVVVLLWLHLAPAPPPAPHSARRVEDSLLAAGRQHETDRERRRQDQLIKEGRELTFTPELNPKSRAIMERIDEPIEERMVRHVRALAMKRAHALAAQQMEEARSMPTFRPAINHNVPVRQSGDVITRYVLVVPPCCCCVLCWRCVMLPHSAGHLFGVLSLSLSLPPPPLSPCCC